MHICTQSAYFTDNNCNAVETENGFTLDSTFENCGFEATHENGVVTFSNTITGDNVANNGDGPTLYMGSSVSFTVSCQFFDQSSISSQVELEGADFSGDGPEITGDNQPQTIDFSLVAYTDAARTGKVP